MIRLATAADAAAVQAVYAPVVEHTATSFEMVPPGVEEMQSRIEKTLARYPWLVAEDGSDFLGYAYAGVHRARAAYQWTAEVSVYVSRAHRRRGVARGLYTALLAILRLQGFRLAVAGITLPNAASVALHEALGFRAVGVYPRIGYKMGTWWDTGWWQMDLWDAGDLRAPGALVEIGVARGMAPFDAALKSGTDLIR